MIAWQWLLLIIPASMLAGVAAFIGILVVLASRSESRSDMSD